MKQYLSRIKDLIRQIDPDETTQEWDEGECTIVWEGVIECDNWIRDGIPYNSIKYHTDSCTLIFDTENASGEIELTGKYLSELSWNE